MTDPTAERIVARAEAGDAIDMIRLKQEITTALAEARREVWRRAIKAIEERVQFDEKYRLGDIEKLRSGWSGIESGPCCEKCAMTERRPPRDPLQMLCGCWNPFQLSERCECHLPFRKVVGEAIHQKFVEL